MDFRISLANGSSERVAQVGLRMGLAGSVIEAFGFGPWGIETGVIVEMDGVTREDATAFVHALFAAYPEEDSVFVDDGRRGETWWRDGRIE